MNVNSALQVIKLLFIIIIIIIIPISPGYYSKDNGYAKFFGGKKQGPFDPCENGELKSKPLKVVSLTAIFSVVTQHSSS